eukprot:jgi/Bigna1/85140/estExt_fgenesh1_pg.C_20290
MGNSCGSRKSRLFDDVSEPGWCCGHRKGIEEPRTAPWMSGRSPLVPEPYRTRVTPRSALAATPQEHEEFDDDEFFRFESESPTEFDDNHFSLPSNGKNELESKIDLSNEIDNEDSLRAKADEYLMTGYSIFNGNNFQAVDQALGLKYIRKAASLKSDCARAMLLHQGDVHGGRNMEKALADYRKAAAQGHPLAQVQLGNCFLLGDGVEKDPVTAEKWYRRAAETGNATGQRCLGSCYQFGYGVAVNYRQAFKWHKKAAIQGHGVSCYNVGWCYKMGFGTNSEPVLAYKYLSRACNQGLVYAESELEDLIKNFPELRDASYMEIDG